MKYFTTLALSLCMLNSSFVYASADLTGFWRSIDDKTGFTKGIVEISKEKNGTYNGKIIEITPRPGYNPKTHCNDCPAPYTNQPVIGLEVIKGMKPNDKNPNEYAGGTILDPITGKIYKSKIRLNTKADRITLRGFIGVEMIGRSQHWVRHNP